MQTLETNGSLGMDDLHRLVEHTAMLEALQTGITNRERDNSLRDVGVGEEAAAGERKPAWMRSCHLEAGRSQHAAATAVSDKEERFARKERC